MLTAQDSIAGFQTLASEHTQTEEIDEAASQLSFISFVTASQDRSRDLIHEQKTKGSDDYLRFDTLQACQPNTSSDDSSFSFDLNDTSDHHVGILEPRMTPSTVSVADGLGLDETNYASLSVHGPLEDTICSNRTPPSSSEELSPWIGISIPSLSLDDFDVYRHSYGSSTHPQSASTGTAISEGQAALFVMDVAGIGEQFAGYNESSQHGRPVRLG